MKGYRLSVPAQVDLSGIFDYYFEEAGYGVARKMAIEFVEAFRAIGRNPGIGHKRQDLARNRSILFWPMRDYLNRLPSAGRRDRNRHDRARESRHRAAHSAQGSIDTTVQCCYEHRSIRPLARWGHVARVL